ncbi:MAG: formylglycine-generating enzyme family protein [Candidatus Latescibacterota bacterium]
MQDWAYGLVIVICAIVWVHVFVDYRRRLVRVAPGMEEVSARKQEFHARITESEAHTDDIARSIEELETRIVELERVREELQLQANRKQMVLIPAGSFEMGSGVSGRDDEAPAHRVSLKAYYIDRCEVTNMEYKDFIDSTGHRAPIHWRNRTFPQARQADHPVTNVSWHDAQAYATWACKRLPTEAEWERAARGSQGHDYPWGRNCTPEYANYGNPEGYTTPVDRYRQGCSSFGVWDLCGNAGEWVQDWYDPKYYVRSPEADPAGPPDGFQKVYRGGGYHGNRMDIRSSARHFAAPNSYQQFIGFRCAMSLESETAVPPGDG